MTSPPSLSDEARLRSLIRSVLQEDGLLKRGDSEQTIENSLQPGIPSPSVDPFTAHWYASLIPHKIREPFKAPDSNPVFFNIRDAQHAALFNRNTPAGASPEADLLYQAIAFMHRSLDDILPLIERQDLVDCLIDRQELVDVWKNIKGVSEMLHTRYDLLCALRRSRDDEHVRYLEMFMEPPSGEGAASAKVHREICRAISRKRHREDSRDDDAPPPARAKTVNVKPEHGDDVETVTPARASHSSKVKASGTKDTKDSKKPQSSPAKKSSTPAKKSSAPRTPKSKTAEDASKSKRSTPAKSNSSPIVSRTRSSDVTKRLRSSSTPARSGSRATPAKAGKPVAMSKNKQVASAKKSTPKKALSLSKQASPIKKKVKSEKKANPSKSAAADKTTPKKQRASTTKSLPDTNGTATKTSARDKKSSSAKKVTSNKKVMSDKEEAPSKSQASPKEPPKDMASAKKPGAENKVVATDQSTADQADEKMASANKSNSENKVVSTSDSESKVVSTNQSTADKADEKTRLDDTLTPQVNGANVTDLQTDEEIKVVHVKLIDKNGPNDEKKETTKSTDAAIKSGDSVKPGSARLMTNSTCVIRGDKVGELRSAVHMHAGFQWRIVVYPRGDKHKDWMSVYLECGGPLRSDTGAFGGEPSPAEPPKTDEAKSDEAWSIRVKFSVRVLRTDSAVTKAVLEGKAVSVDNEDGLLSASKDVPDGKVARAGLLSDYVGAISHDFSPSSDQVGFSRFAPTSCLDPGMYADDDRNIVLILFMRTE